MAVSLCGLPRSICKYVRSVVHQADRPLRRERRGELYRSGDVILLFRILRVSLPSGLPQTGTNKNEKQNKENVLVPAEFFNCYF